MGLSLFTGARLDIHMNDPGNRTGPSKAPAANIGHIHRMKCGEYGGSFSRKTKPSISPTMMSRP